MVSQIAVWFLPFSVPTSQNQWPVFPRPPTSPLLLYANLPPSHIQVKKRLGKEDPHRVYSLPALLSINRFWKGSLNHKRAICTWSVRLPIWSLNWDRSVIDLKVPGESLSTSRTSQLVWKSGSQNQSISMHTPMHTQLSGFCLYIHICIYIYICVCIYTYIYI